jgi:hypothetical protein
MGQQGALEKEKKKSKVRGPSWRLWETRCGIHAVISIRDKFSQGLVNAEMMREFNRLFGDLVDECEKLNQCVDHHGLQDRFLLLVVHHVDAHIHVFMWNARFMVIYIFCVELSRYRSRTNPIPTGR